MLFDGEKLLEAVDSVIKQAHPLGQAFIAD
jgi:hypothetical protein